MSMPSNTDAFVLRPKLAWGCINAAIAAWSAVEAFAQGGWLLPACAAFYGLTSAGAFRSYIRVEGNVLYRRGLIGWYAPLDLHRLATVELTRLFGLKEPYPHLGLRLRDGDGHAQTVSLRWWSNWRMLATAVAEAVSDTSSIDPDRREWLLDLDPKTRGRLQRFL